MTWTLFLDDERAPSWWLTDVLVARDCDEARTLVREMGCPSVISFDHDLGKPETGLSFLWWMIDEDLDGRLDLKAITQVIVHSMNPTGARNIAGLWDGYARDIESDVRAKIDPYRAIR